MLYASELPGYIDMIPEFYNEIKEQPRVRQEEVDEEFADVCEVRYLSFVHPAIALRNQQ